MVEGGAIVTAEEVRRRWRALLLVIKAKLESVESGIETFEEAFASQIVLANGQTVGAVARASIGCISRCGQYAAAVAGKVQS